MSDSGIDRTPDAGGAPLEGQVGRERLRREDALDLLRAAIVEGRLAPGQRLTERDLCATLGTSRTIVREVVRQLETERLVDVVAHRGLRIARLTPKLVREIYELRAELEVLVIRSFIAVAHEDDIARLREHFRAVEDSAAAHDLVAVVAAVTGFLRHMVEIANHEIAADMLDHLLARINRLRILAMRAPGRLERSIEELRQMLEAISLRDSQAAETIVRNYLAAACAAALASDQLSDGSTS